MKIIKTCLIDGEEIELQSENIILELNATGRGFVTVKTDKDCRFKKAVLEVGEYDNYHRWFDGFVEQEQQAENGYKRLFIREQVAVLARQLNCSLRHVTLQDVCAWLEKETGLIFKIPSANYSREPIPLFTHAGSGYQFMTNIGRQFQIPQYIWQQFPDGSVYVGSWDDSSYADDSFEVDSQDTLAQSSTSMSIPFSPDIRPGSIVNGKRIHQVKLQGSSLQLDWQDLGHDGKPLQKSAERRAIEKEFPELAGGYHLSRYAKIVAIADPSKAGDIADPFRPKYAVDIQLLDENNQADNDIPVFHAVPLPITSPSSQGGDFAYPEIGTVVEIGFINGRSDKPVIRNFYPQGKTIPQVGIGEMLRQQRPEVFERTDASGNMYKETDQMISEKSFTREITTDSETKNIGESTRNIDANEQVSVGGNKTTHVMGKIEEVTASDKLTGVGGNLTERVKGVISFVSKTKAELKAPLSYMGSDGQNIFRILEELIQIVADLAKEVADHTHNGGPKPDQKPAFDGYNSQATSEKAKLSPIIA